MARFLTAYAAALVVMLGLDFAWLGVFARKLYADEIGPLLLAKPMLAAGVLFYAIYAAGVVLFVVRPAVERGRWVRAAGLGALFGVVAYAAYDLTNLATLKGYSAKLATIDMAWGAVITAAAASAGYFAAKALRT
jgi:uncharacterized membrane protein